MNDPDSPCPHTEAAARVACVAERRRPRILQIIPTLDRSGAEKQLTLLARGLAAEFDVHVCALTRGGPLLDELSAAGVPTTVIGKRLRIDPQAFWRLRRYVARLRPDLIQTWLFAGNAYGRAAGLACGVRHLLANERCVDPWKGWTELAVDRALARRTDRIVTNSPAIRDFYVARGLPAEKMVIIPNAVPAPPPCETTRQQMLDEFGLPSDCHVAGLVARFWPQKRIKSAIWSADQLKAAGVNLHLLIFGDGPQRARLEKYREQVRIRDRVHFLGQRDDLARWLPHFDQLWSTSRYEGQSNAILEAMAAGVPVVATDIPGTRDLVIHGTTGYLVPLSDRAGLAKYSYQLLEQPEQARQVAAAARQRALDEFGIAPMIDRYAALYRQVLAD